MLARKYLVLLVVLSVINFFLQELIEKLGKGELPKDEYSCMNAPSPSNQGNTGRSQSASARSGQSTTAPHSMRARRTAAWARSRSSDDGYSRQATLH